MESKNLTQVEFTRVDGGARKATENMVKETALTIRIGGKPYATAMILSVMEREFVFGHLFTQGIIHSARDIRSLTIKNNVAEVVLAGTSKKKQVNHKITSKLKVRPSDIFICMKAILKSEVFTETEAVHSAGLFLNGSDAICITEDLGEYNAVDKVIGYGLLHKVNFGQTVVAATGRQPSEMICKYRNVNIPIIVTRGVPTTLAIETAEKAGVTMVGRVRGKNMMVYSHPERIG